LTVVCWCPRLCIAFEYMYGHSSPQALGSCRWLPLNHSTRACSLKSLLIAGPAAGQHFQLETIFAMLYQLPTTAHAITSLHTSSCHLLAGHTAALGQAGHMLPKPQLPRGRENSFIIHGQQCSRKCTMLPPGTLYIHHKTCLQAFALIPLSASTPARQGHSFNSKSSIHKKQVHIGERR
jgi:hypothetical protein